MPNWKKVITSGSDAILNNVTASNGIQVGGNILPDSDNTLSLGTSDLRFQLNGGTPVTVTGSGTANTLTRFQSTTTVEDSNIFSSDTLTRISHDNDGNDIFIVSGSNGELIKVTDSVTDTLFQVNDGSGITKLEVSSSGLTTTSDVEIDDWGSVSASLASLDASTYNDSDVTDHINSLEVVSGSSQITISDTTGYTAFSSSIASDIAAIDSSVTLQDATDNGATTTNTVSVPGITINSSGSDFLKLGFNAGENASTDALIGDGGVIIGTNALGSFSSNTSKVTIVGNYTADQTTNFGDLVTLVGSTIASGTNRNVGDHTTAVGAQALNGQTGGNEGNTAIGTNALFNFKGGNWNVALGYNAGPQATLTGSEGIYIGKNAGQRHNSYNVPPSQSIYIGTDVKSTFGSSYGAAMTVNEIVIGNNVNGRGKNTVTIGNSSTTDNYFSGNISGSDVTIDDWGSVSSSLADLNSSIDGIDSSVTLQDATDNGNTTTNDIITSGTVSGSALQLQADGQTSLFQVESISVSSNSTTIASYAVDTYAGAIIDYTLYHNTKPTGMRTGQLFIVFDEDGEIRVTDSSTSDIGDTSGVTFEGSNNGTTAAVSMETPDANWNIKMIRRSL